MKEYESLIGKKVGIVTDARATPYNGDYKADHSISWTLEGFLESETETNIKLKDVEAHGALHFSGRTELYLNKDRLIAIYLNDK